MINGRLIEIRKDSLLFTNFFNENVAEKAGFNLDTISIHYKQLDELKLVADRALGLFKEYSMDKYDFFFKENSIKHEIPSEWVPLYLNDNSSYEIVPHLTAQGMCYLFEENGQTYYFYGTGLTKPDKENMDRSYDVRNVIWFTPCTVEKINGLAVGLLPSNIKNDSYNEKDSLTINGLNLHADIFSMYSLLFNPQIEGPYADSIEFYEEYLKKDIETTINGVNISLGRHVNEAKINGVNLVALMTIVDEIDGLSISGISNFAYKINGLTIAPYNRSTSIKGVQIGLFNKATNLQGIQIGLWNVNGKRSLPFINWQF